MNLLLILALASETLDAGRKVVAVQADPVHSLTLLKVVSGHRNPVLVLANEPVTLSMPPERSSSTRQTPLLRVGDTCEITSVGATQMHLFGTVLTSTNNGQKARVRLSILEHKIIEVRATGPGTAEVLP
ncbi:MAG: hypothetical protein NVS9B15_12900 [Acidobacteriaceae bacterium]